MKTLATIHRQVDQAVQSIRWHAWILLGVVAFIGVCWFWWYLSAPARVVERAFAAMNAHDSDALAGLASSKERHVMNLTQTTVSVVLRQTWWQNSRVRPVVHIGSPRAIFADLLLFPVTVEGFPASGKPILWEYAVYRDPSGSWRLCLSNFLYSLPKICNGTSEDNQTPAWDTIAGNAGIRGRTSPDGRTVWINDTFEPRVYLSHD